VLAKILSKHGFQCRGVFGSKVTILRDDDRRQTFRNVGEDEADRSRMCLRLPTTYGKGSVSPWRDGSSQDQDCCGRIERSLTPRAKHGTSRCFDKEQPAALFRGLSQLPKGIHRARIA
jgi:hypothetical protein